MVGWVVWVASIVAAVLYALGFGYFTTVAAEAVWATWFEELLLWMTTRITVASLAIIATTMYACSLARESGGGAQWTNIGKLIVFAILIAGGLWALLGQNAPTITRRLTPFFSHGALGLFQAMGFTFIALQGFDLIAPFHVPCCWHFPQLLAFICRCCSWSRRWVYRTVRPSLAAIHCSLAFWAASFERDSGEVTFLPFCANRPALPLANG